MFLALAVIITAKFAYPYCAVTSGDLFFVRNAIADGCWSKPRRGRVLVVYGRAKKVFIRTTRGDTARLPQVPPRCAGAQAITADPARG
jgi:hypothetical protein